MKFSNLNLQYASEFSMWQFFKVEKIVSGIFLQSRPSFWAPFDKAYFSPHLLFYNLKNEVSKEDVTIQSFLPKEWRQLLTVFKIAVFNNFRGFINHRFGSCLSSIFLYIFYLNIFFYKICTKIETWDSAKSTTPTGYCHRDFYLQLKQKELAKFVCVYVNSILIQTF